MSSNEYQQYVCGFVFFKHLNLPDRVLLILKDRPDWQAGKYNGIGGKVEPGEYPLAAMQRECFEEADLNIDKWRNFARMEAADFQIQCYAANLDTTPQWKSKTTEKVFAYPVNCLPTNLVGSVAALIHLARTKEADFSVIYVK